MRKQKQYAPYISKWILFCDKRKINSECPTLNQVLEFLNSLFESGLSYSAINSARSAFDFVMDEFCLSEE
jgi:hypothetical protein